MSLRLDTRPENKNILKDYVLKRQNVNADNTSFAVQNSYVFTERDIPGYKNRVDVLFGEARSALYESMKREAKKKTHKKKWEPYVRKTIPSMCSTFSSDEPALIRILQLEHTAIVGKVRDEFNCTPVENEEFRQISEARALEALKPKRETKFVAKISGKMLQPKNVVPGDKGAFVVSYFLQ